MNKELTPWLEEQNVGGYNSYDCVPDGVKACGQLLAPTDDVTIRR